MTTSLQTLLLTQLDATLTRWRDAALPARPARGWIHAIRKALGMSSIVLAKRLGITSSAVRQLENSEAQDSITLNTLRHVAEALDCELQYALVPRQTLNAMRTERALQVARDQVQTVAHSMALEDQTVAESLTQAQIEDIARELLTKSGKGLWQ